MAESGSEVELEQQNEADTAEEGSCEAKKETEGIFAVYFRKAVDMTLEKSVSSLKWVEFYQNERNPENL